MLHTMGLVLLTIAKIIGICLGVLLGIAILLICLVLFVPIRYHCEGVWGKQEQNISVRISYLYPLFCGKAVFQNGKGSVRFRLLWFSLYPKTDAKKSSKPLHFLGEEAAKARDEEIPGEEAAKARDEEIPGEEAAKARDEEIPGEEAAKARDEKIPGEEAAKAWDEEIPEEETSWEDTPGDDVAGSHKRKKGIRERIHSLKFTWQRIRRRVLEAAGRVKNIKKRISVWNRFWNLEETKITVSTLKEELFRAVRYLLPIRGHGKLHFGFDDPAVTGQTLGLISIFYGCFPDKLELEPDFHDKILEGSWKFSGRMRVIYFLRRGIRLYRMEAVRKTFRRFRRLNII